MNPDENNNPSNNPADEPGSTPEPTTPVPENTEPAVEPTSEPATESTPEPTVEPVAPASSAAPLAEPTPAQKKSATLTIVLLAIAVVLVIVGIVVAVMLLSNNSSKSNSEEDDAISNGTVLVCSASADASTTPESLGNIISYDGELRAHYDAEGNLEDIDFAEDFGLADAAAAAEYLAGQETAYNKVLENLGLASDPFGSSFSTYENIASVYHYAESDMLTADNITIFRLKAKDDGTFDTSPEAIEAVYTALDGLNYSCSLQDDDEEEDEEDGEGEVIYEEDATEEDVDEDEEDTEVEEDEE